MILDVSNLSFGYGARRVLDSVGFSLQKGEMLAVLGENGAGKSTLLKCVSQVLRPRSGSVKLEGRDVRELGRNETARRLAYVPQHWSGQEMCVMDMVLLGRRPHARWAWAEHDMDIVRQTLGRMGLEEFAMRPVRDLSGGEAQKVVLARALAQQPKVLVLDEPTSSLDLRNQLSVMELISGFVRDLGLSVLLAVHDLNLAMRYADRFLLLRDGAVQACLKAEELNQEIIHDVYGVEAIVDRVQGYPVVVAVGENGVHNTKSKENDNVA